MKRRLVWVGVAVTTLLAGYVLFHDPGPHFWSIDAKPTGPMRPSSPERALAVTISASRGPIVSSEKGVVLGPDDWVGQSMKFVLAPGEAFASAEIGADCNASLNWGRGRGFAWKRCTPAPTEHIEVSLEDVPVWQDSAEKTSVVQFTGTTSYRAPALAVRVAPANPLTRVELVSFTNDAESRSKTDEKQRTCLPTGPASDLWASATCTFVVDRPEDERGSVEVKAIARTSGACTNPMCQPERHIRIESITVTR